MKSSTVVHSCPFFTGCLVMWRVSIFHAVFKEMVNDFHGISHKASTKILGFSLQGLNNFISMPSFCCHPKKSITSLVHHTPDTHYYHPVHMTNIQNHTLLPPQKNPQTQKTCKLPHLGKKEAFVSLTCTSHLFLAQCTCKLKRCNTFLSKGLNSLKGRNLEVLNPI